MKETTFILYYVGLFSGPPCVRWRCGWLVIVCHQLMLVVVIILPLFVTQGTLKALIFL